MTETRAIHRLIMCGLFVLSGLVQARIAQAQDNQLCLMCHADESLFAGQEDPGRLVVDQDEYSSSVHGAMGMSCTMCHQGWTFPHTPEMGPVDCGVCHRTEQSTFDNSVHGYALQRGNPQAPTCALCHGTHNILHSSNPDSPTHRLRVPETCATCHGTAGVLTTERVRLPQPFAAYERSVHGVRSEQGVEAAANCTDCHGVHDLRSALDPLSKISSLNVSTTCGQCHTEIQNEYDASIHGRALQAGLADSPSCVDCHGEHLILSPSDPDAPTTGERLATQTCGPCHDDPEIISKYNLQGGVVGSYLDSYHGWASRGGYGAAATCYDCHTAHSVLPAADSASSIYPGNVAATCGQCHEGADRAFALSYDHRAAGIETNPVNQLIRTIYLALIAVTIGGMVVHNLVIMNYYVMERRKQLLAAEYVTRFDRSELIQHLALTISFAVLVITGFALRFPDAWWVKALAGLGLTEPIRSTMHRIGGVVLILASLVHLHHLLFVKRGREGMRAMVPQLRDFKDAIANLKFHTWRSDRHVEFGRFDYTHKVEYWALIWGTAVMVITGLILWFPEKAVRILPTLAVTVSQTIHYYEAWLATLAILVWHFFFVIFHPDAYPMSWAWLTGKMSRDEIKRHHGRWYEEEIAGAEDPGTAH
jgi:formate dehydrogenase gamma subunit